MTDALHTGLFEVPDLPNATTPVLIDRKLRPGTDRESLSVFGDDRWDLTPAIFENHLPMTSLNFMLVPPAFRHITKIYIWLEINNKQDVPLLRHAKAPARMAIFTMKGQLRNLRSLLEWLDIHGITSLDAVTSDDLDRYLQAVRNSEQGVSLRGDKLHAVRRLWAFRDLLPPVGRLPAEPPWRGRDSRLLLGRPQRDRENLTERIPENTMTPLLSWALRFVEDFSDDIVTAFTEYRPLVGSTRGRRRLPGADNEAKSAWLTKEIDRLLAEYAESDVPLPCQVNADGSRRPHFAHLGRLLDVNYQRLGKDEHRVRIEQFYAKAEQEGRPRLADGACLRHRPQAHLDGEPWLTDIRYTEVPTLVHMLSTACLIVTAYLSGMRPGEALNLKRGCASHDPRTGLWRIDGRKWKGAVDANGEKIPEGQDREEPWIVTEAVVRAVAVVEQLHDQPLLFPPSVVSYQYSLRDGARTSKVANQDMNTFVNWVNDYCKSRGRTDGIPVPTKVLNISRLRRTLAWFICRRLRGLVAAAIQYGHVKVQITQGYAGGYSSGFPDDLAFEQWLARLDALEDADRRLRNGEHVSGPAADAYRSRVAGGAGRFAGRVLRSGRQARHLLANPSLQIHEGKGMTCVFNAATALCELTPTTDDARHTPDTDDCRPNCRNIARTERDIDQLRAEADDLRSVVDDVASPPLRLARERQRLHQLDMIIADHQLGRSREGTA